MVALCAWFQAGAYLDAWAHVHLTELESFFTPWHAVLYSGFLAVAALTAAPLLRRRVPGRAWNEALPAGYDLSLVGALVFLLGGVLDMLWHIVFGIEADVEALLSPSHLVLAVGSTLMLTGPLRSGWRRTQAGSWRTAMPMMLSASFLLSSISFWTLYMHPLSRPWAAAGNQPTVTGLPVVAADPIALPNGLMGSLFIAHGMGVGSILLQSAVLTGLVLLLVRRWGHALPAGGFTIALTLNALMLGFARDQLVLVPFIAAGGVAIDALVRRLGAAPALTRLRVFAFLVPAVYYACFFAGVALTKGVWWSVPLWTGSIVLAALTGWLTSYLVFPPVVPARR
ncbi:MAG TPA: hypothetical protein VMR23_11335 [Candidatus Limnocylindria bacterium]|nr:hypothetical protein [Candidatus Limnocylindria bacterium]